MIQWPCWYDSGLNHAVVWTTKLPYFSFHINIHGIFGTYILDDELYSSSTELLTTVQQLSVRNYRSEPVLLNNGLNYVSFYHSYQDNYSFGTHLHHNCKLLMYSWQLCFWETDPRSLIRSCEREIKVATAKRREEALRARQSSRVQCDGRGVMEERQKSKWEDWERKDRKRKSQGQNETEMKCSNPKLRGRHTVKDLRARVCGSRFDG